MVSLAVCWTSLLNIQQTKDAFNWFLDGLFFDSVLSYPFLDTAPFFPYYSCEKKFFLLSTVFVMQTTIIYPIHIPVNLSFYQPLQGEMSYFFIVLSSILVLALYIFYDQLKRHRQRVLHDQNSFARQLIDSMETERKRIATELHDSIGQELLIIKNRALLALNDLKNKQNIREQLDEISQTASRAIQETREITYNLRPYQIDRLGLKKSLESIIYRAARTTTISFTSDIDPIDHLIPQEMEIHVYRIIQEIVNNIIKHAQATEGKVIIKRWYDRLNIDVEDNGIGFDISLQNSQNTRGIGLYGIAERTRLIGGIFRIESTPGKGTRILLTIKTYDRIDVEH
jgi:signal transduction histidine kinase